jgi:hypothetical protein
MGSVEQAGSPNGGVLPNLRSTRVDPGRVVGGPGGWLVDGRTGGDLPGGVWLREEVRERTIFADQYYFAVSLLMLADDAPPVWHDEEAEEDVNDRFTAGATLGRR